jgi:XTP/dITP diphosphohydrolase
MPPLLVLGTRNRKKGQEIREILDGLGIEFADLSRWPDLPEVVEDGDTFEANARKKATELAPLPEDGRAAYYVCTAALADPAGEVRAVVEGRCHGVIIHERRGSGGFGYDPLFLIREYHHTFGELTPRVKHALSHRARALAQLRPLLKNLMAGDPEAVTRPQK